MALVERKESVLKVESGGSNGDESSKSWRGGQCRCMGVGGEWESWGWFNERGGGGSGVREGGGGDKAVAERERSSPKVESSSGKGDESARIGEVASIGVGQGWERQGAVR